MHNTPDFPIATKLTRSTCLTSNSTYHGPQKAETDLTVIIDEFHFLSNCDSGGYKCHSLQFPEMNYDHTKACFCFLWLIIIMVTGGKVSFA